MINFYREWFEIFKLKIGYCEERFNPNHDEKGRFASIDSVGGSGIINTKDKFGKTGMPQRFETSQQEIDGLLLTELKNIKFSAPVVYNPRLRASYGQTRTMISQKGKILNQIIEIGKQRKSGVKELVDTIVHEEFEARIIHKAYGQKIAKYIEMDKLGEKGTHPYIIPRVNRYLRMKGLI